MPIVAAYTKNTQADTAILCVPVTRTGARVEYFLLVVNIKGRNNPLHLTAEKKTHTLCILKGNLFLIDSWAAGR